MDPLGLALENFNAFGVWRDQERGQSIDASGQLITGEKLHDVRDLKRILKTRHRLDFYRCLTEKMLTYALGRGLDMNDVETVDRIVDAIGSRGGAILGAHDGRDRIPLLSDAAKHERGSARNDQVVRFDPKNLGIP